MGKNILIIGIILSSLLISPSHVQAQNSQKEAGQSGKIIATSNLKVESVQNTYSIKKMAIKNVLERNKSPMGENDIEEFIKQAKERNMNPYLLPAISGVESGYCKNTHPGSFNCFGWDRGFMVFENYSEGIATVAEGLDTKYIQKGADSIEKIGKIYAESEAWPNKVKKFIDTFEEEEKKIQLFFSSDTVKL